MVSAPEPLLVFIRRAGETQIACVFNMGAAPAVFGDERLAGAAILGPGAGEATLDGAALHMGAHSARFLRLA